MITVPWFISERHSTIAELTARKGIWALKAILLNFLWGMLPACQNYGTFVGLHTQHVGDARKQDAYATN